MINLAKSLKMLISLYNIIEVLIGMPSGDFLVQYFCDAFLSLVSSELCDSLGYG